MALNDLRLELRTRNNVLWHAIFDTCASVSDFCRRYGYRDTEIGGFLNLTRSPYRANGSPRLLAQQLADRLSLLVEDLFPKDLYEATFPRRLSAEIPSHAYVGLAAARRLALPPVHDDKLLQDEIRGGIDAALETLTPREAKVIRLRYGLGGDEEHTLESVGDMLRVTGTHIRQIEAAAMRKLRHPSRARQLVPYVHAVTGVRR